MNYTKHFKIEKPLSLYEFFKTQEGLNHLELEELLDFGAIYINKSRNSIDAGYPMQTGDYLRVHTKPKRFPSSFNKESLIQFENEAFLVAQKPYSLPSLPTLDNRKENLEFLLSQAIGQKLYSVHQLDQKTTGLIIFAKSSRAASEIGGLFNERKISKTYRMLSRDSIAIGEHTAYMHKSKNKPKQLNQQRSSYFDQICKLEVLQSKEIDLGASFINNSRLYPPENIPEEKVFESKIQLITGRTHQIRAQLSCFSNGILGDQVYGNEGQFPVFSLQAYKLWFNFKGSAFNFIL